MGFGIDIYVVQAVHGLVYGMLLFLVASGLTLVFGMMGVLNLAHAGFYMLGAYFAYSVVAWSGNVLVLMAALILKTRIGITVRAAVSDAEMVDALGTNVPVVFLGVFSIGSALAGLAGSLFALFQGFVSTGCIDTASSMHVIFLAFIGGVGSFFGPILGTGVYLYFTDWVSRITDRWEFVLGVLFILLVLYARTGLVGLLSNQYLKGLIGRIKPAKGAGQ